MDYNCRDIPMRLNIRYQPLNFDIYFSQVTDPPNTSIEEQPYDFRVENEALALVDQMIDSQKRKQLIEEKPQEQIEQHNPLEQLEQLKPLEHPEQLGQQQQQLIPITPPTPPPSCPIETLTPIKSSITSNNDKSEEQKSSQIDPKDFEDVHYNPFDHLELQTIDELRELDLIFQAAYQPTSDT